MVKFNVVSASSFDCAINNMFHKGETENVIRVSNMATIGPDINVENKSIIEFVAKCKKININKSDVAVRKIIRGYNVEKVKRGVDADIISCLMAANRIKQEALQNIYDYTESYVVTFDMRNMNVDTFGNELILDECKAVRLIDVMNFFKNYCNTPFIDIDFDITLCISDIDFEFLDIDIISNVMLDAGSEVTFTDCSDCKYEKSGFGVSDDEDDEYIPSFLDDLDELDEEETINVDEMFEHHRKERQKPSKKKKG